MNRLDRKAVRQVEDLLMSLSGEIAAGRWSVQSLASHAERKLGRPVTPHNIRSCCRTMDIAIPTQHGNRKTTLLQTAARVKVVAKALVQLFGQLGVTAPPELIDIANPPLDSMEEDD
jgi:hypothetical protein